MSAHAKNRPVAVNRRKLLQATLAGSALASVGGIDRVLASNVAPYHFSRTPAYQEGAAISVLVPSFQAIGDTFMRNQAAEFGEATGIQVDMQFLPFEKAMDRQTTLVAAKSGEVDVFGTHYAQIGKFGEGNGTPERSGGRERDQAGGLRQRIVRRPLGRRQAPGHPLHLRPADALLPHRPLRGGGNRGTADQLGRVRGNRAEAEQPAGRLRLHHSRQGRSGACASTATACGRTAATSWRTVSSPRRRPGTSRRESRR